MNFKNIEVKHISNTKLYLYKSQSDYAQISLIIKSGANQEPERQNIIAHFVEHACLSYRSFKKFDYIKKNNYYINPKHFVFTGCTDFDHMILNITTKNTLKNIIDAVIIIKHILLGNLIKDYLAKKIIKQIILENQKNKFKNLQNKQITAFITDNHIQYIPAGSILNINKINIRNAKKYLLNNFAPNNIAIMSYTNQDSNTMTKIIINILKKFLNSKENNFSNRHVKQDTKQFSTEILCLSKFVNKRSNHKFCLLKPKVNIFFKFDLRKQDANNKLIIFLIELLIKNKTLNAENNLLNQICDLNLCYKFIRYDFNFLVLSFEFKNFSNDFNKRRDDFNKCVKEYSVKIKKVIDEILKINFTSEDIKFIEIFLKHNLQTDGQVINYSAFDILEYAKNNFLYNDEIIFVDQIWDRINILLKTITIKHINDLKNYLFDHCYKTVITIL